MRHWFCILYWWLISKSTEWYLLMQHLWDENQHTACFWSLFLIFHNTVHIFRIPEGARASITIMIIMIIMIIMQCCVISLCSVSNPVFAEGRKSWWAWRRWRRAASRRDELWTGSAWSHLRGRIRLLKSANTTSQSLSFASSTVRLPSHVSRPDNNSASDVSAINLQSASSQQDDKLKPRETKIPAEK